MKWSPEIEDLKKKPKDKTDIQLLIELNPYSLQWLANLSKAAENYAAHCKDANFSHTIGQGPDFKIHESFNKLLEVARANKYR